MMRSFIGAVLTLSFLLQLVAGRAINRAIATPVKNTGKRGLSYNEPSYTLPFSLSGQNSQVSWSYNWGQTQGSGANPVLDYVPMLWSNDSDLLSAWPTNAQAAINAGSSALLGFNEPDLCQGGSSCMDVQSAVTVWKKYMDPFAGKALLGSPAVTNAGAPDGLTWLQNFLNNCTGCQVDFINIHWYSNKWAGASYFKSQVQAAHAMSGGRPVWITEFGLDDSDGTYTTADLQAFLEEVLPWMDAQNYVHRYAYFMATPGILLNSAGTGMSDTGVLYNNYPQVNPTTTSATLSASSSSSTAVRTTTTSVSSRILVSTSAKTSTNSPTATTTGSSRVTSSSATSATRTPVQNSSSSLSKTISAGNSTAPVTRTSVQSSSSSTKTVPLSTGTMPSSSSKSVLPSISTTTATKSPAQSASSIIKSISLSSSTVSVAKTVVPGASSTAKLPVSSTKSVALAVSPGLQILSAFYADKDVTAAAQTAFVQSGNLVIDTSALSATLAVSDPWLGTVKTISVLYTNNGSTYVFSTVEKTGIYTISPVSIPASSQTPSIATTRGASIDIVGIVWGTVQVKTPSVFDTLDSEQATDWGFQMSTSLFGFDGLFGTAKVGIVWYRDAQGTLKSLVSKEDGWVKF